MTDPNTSRTLNSILLVVLLGAMAAALAALTIVTARAAGAAEDPDLQRVLARLAWLALVLLGGALVLLLWAVMRLARSRLPRPGRGAPTPYVDAWSLAGRRFQLPKDEPEPPEGEDAEKDEDSG